MKKSPPHIKPFRDAKSTRPHWLKAINGLGKLTPKLMRPNADKWIEQATKIDGGEVDHSLREALEVLVQSLNDECDLNLMGRLSAQDDTVRMIRTHLRIKQRLQSTPEILTTTLPSPVFIIGLPRTGSTFLHQLMAQDVNNRTIPYWESFDPVKPLVSEDRRAAKVDKMLTQMEGVAPGYHAIHPMTAKAPEECVALFMNNLRTLQFDIQYRASGYVNWLFEQEASIAYGDYLKQLKMIQYYRRSGERFLLKDPTHACHLDTVLNCFPNAKIIFIHRDPVYSLSSICSLYAYTRAIFSDTVNATEIGKEVLGGYWPKTIDKIMSARASLPDSQFIDLRQRDLARDPIATVASAYEKWGYELNDDAKRNMQLFLDNRAVNFPGVHEHSLQNMGVEEGDVNHRFARYIETFDLQA